MRGAATKARPALRIARPSSSVQRSAAAAAAEDEARIVINCSKRLHQAVKLRALQRDVTIRDYILALLLKDGVQ